MLKNLWVRENSMKNYFILHDQDEYPIASVILDGIDSTIINGSGELHIKYDGNCNGLLVHGVSKESYAKMCEKLCTLNESNVANVACEDVRATEEYSIPRISFGTNQKSIVNLELIRLIYLTEKLTILHTTHSELPITIGYTDPEYIFDKIINSGFRFVRLDTNDGMILFPINEANDISFVYDPRDATFDLAISFYGMSRKVNLKCLSLNIQDVDELIKSIA